DSEAAVAALSEAIERNDQGKFWRSKVTYAEPSETIWSRRLERLRDGAIADRIRTWSGKWGQDGLVLLTLFTLGLLGLVIHKLRGAARWMKWTLLAIVLGGAALRLTVSPEVGLEAWPYTRFLLLSRWVYDGPTLAALDLGPVWMSSVA